MLLILEAGGDKKSISGNEIITVYFKKRLIICNFKAIIELREILILQIIQNIQPFLAKMAAVVWMGYIHSFANALKGTVARIVV